MENSNNKHDLLRACVRACVCVWINIDFVNPVTNRARGEETREDDPCHGQAAPCLRVRCA